MRVPQLAVEFIKAYMTSESRYENRWRRADCLGIHLVEIPSTAHCTTDDNRVSERWLLRMCIAKGRWEKKDGVVIKIDWCHRLSACMVTPCKWLIVENFRSSS